MLTLVHIFPRLGEGKWLHNQQQEKRVLRIWFISNSMTSFHGNSKVDGVTSSVGTGLLNHGEGTRWIACLMLDYRARIMKQAHARVQLYTQIGHRTEMLHSSDYALALERTSAQFNSSFRVCCVTSMMHSANSMSSLCGSTAPRAKYRWCLRLPIILLDSRVAR